MKLSLREKHLLYHELRQFLVSGIALPQAVEALATETSGGVRWVLTQLLEMFLKGTGVADAFVRLQPTISDLEVSLISASSNSGRLEQAFTYLSNYFGTLAEVRAGVVKQAVWPLVQLHLGIIVLNALAMFIGGNFTWPVYLSQTVGALAVIYAAGAVLWIVSALLVRRGQKDVFVDQLLGWVPLVGKMRRNLSLARFCATYEMQLQAAINIMDGLHAAAEASQSARIRAAIEDVLPRVRAGAAVGASLTGSAAFPPALQRAMRLGEETGSLDNDLRNWAGYYQNAAINALNTLGAWLPRLGNLGILVYLGYRIITTYSLILQGYNKTMDFSM